MPAPSGNRRGPNSRLAGICEVVHNTTCGLLHNSTKNPESKRMKVIALIGQKGGTGKTTTATGLAVAASLAGYQTAIIDLDPQTNAANWRDRREGDGPAVVSTQSGRLRPALDASREAGADFVFIDTAGKSDTAAIDAAKVADLVLIPARLQVFDLETLTAVRQILQIAGDPPAAVVVNGTHPNSRNPADEAAAMVGETFGIPVAPVALSHRSAFANAPATGQTAQETEPKGKAATELAKLFEYVEKSTRGIVHKSTRKAVSQ